MELVILAAGMGSRFGGLKQIEPIDEFNNYIIDYSLYDAIEAGFDTVVFIIKKTMYEHFSNTIGKRVDSKIKVKYVFQENENVPSMWTNKINREKPWGTAHALYSARNAINDNFVIINADDFYGKESYKIAYDYLSKIKKNEKGKDANVAFESINTITENGSVKRGICLFDDNNKLKELIESKVECVDGRLVATPLDKSKIKMVLENNSLVSMNMFVFTKDILEYVSDGFVEFLNNKNTDLINDEYLLPDVVSKLIKDNKASVEVLHTPSKWYGVTYALDKEKLVKSISNLVSSGKYKKGLW